MSSKAFESTEETGEAETETPSFEELTAHSGEELSVSTAEEPEPQIAMPSGQPAVAMPSGMNVVVAPPLPLEHNDPNATGPWVRYTGVGTLRIMTPADWKSLGIDSDDYVQWNALNGKKQPTSRFNEAQLNYLLNVDGRFVLDESA